MSDYSPPPPPPKIISDYSLPPISTLASPSTGLFVPLTPTTPTSPSASSQDGRPKKANPLTDLIETEKAYVDQLTGVIRKIAAAWSRSNLPPPDLDTMFRSIEAIYKANRGLLSKLKEIGTNPSSPKALGDLLMRWIDDLESPYTTYCSKYCCGFDSWDPVQSNPKLASIIETFSAAHPPPLTTADPPIWTLDALFLLPKARLKYYKKLYNRLLKSTTPGRSDHRLLIGALDKLDGLLDTLDSRANVQVGSSSRESILPQQESEDEVVIDMRTRSVIDQVAQNGVNEGDQSETSSARGSSFSNSERFSRQSASTTMSRGSSNTMSLPITDLERRLATQRTLDIFTMTPKVVKLQMSPPTLTFTRELRFSVDAVISLVPRSTGVEVVHQQGHIFLLSDLFLVCERMTPEERAHNEGADMWLCYPPLAGKVLRVAEVPGQDNALEIHIMRKETLILYTESVHVRNFIMGEFKDCIEFAGSLPPPSKQPPPPMPPLNGIHGMPRSQSTQNNGSPRSVPQVLGRRSGSMSPPNYRSSSPSMQRSASNGPSSRYSPSSGPVIDGRMMDGMSNLVLSPEAQIQQGAQRVPSLHDPLPGPMYRTSSMAQAHTSPPPQAIGPGQVFPPSRSTSVASSHSLSGYAQNPPFNQSAPQSPGFGPSNPAFSPRHQSPYGPPPGGLPVRPPSADPSLHGSLRNSPSSRSLASQYEQQQQQYAAPPLPSFPAGFQPPPLPRTNSYGSLQAPRPLMPSALNVRAMSMAEPSFMEPSPPNSPVEETPPVVGPVTSTVSAQMKCKVFLKQQHQQWKSIGSAKLKLYRQDPTNIKQLVVEAEDKNKTVLISTIVLTDGVERVGKTGVAIELSDQGARTGIVYMIQLRNEKSAGGLFDSLLAGSDRAH